MSLRGLTFVRQWIASNVDLTFTHPYATKRAQVLALACKQEAATKRIGLQEIEDETGDLEEAMMRLLHTRSPLF